MHRHNTKTQAPLVSSVEIDNHGRPYLAAIAQRCNQFPVLQTILDFATQQRVSNPRLSIIEFANSQVEERSMDSLGELSEYWKAEDECPKPGINGYLYVVEDISPELLETLGSRFNIHPDFFLRHLYLPVTLSSERAETPKRLPARQTRSSKYSRTGISLRYHEMLVQNAPLELGTLYTHSNVRRKVASTRPFPDDGRILGILRNVSLYPVLTQSDPWCVIMLVDAPANGNWITMDGDKASHRVIRGRHSQSYMASVATPSNLWEADIHSPVHPGKPPVTQECLFDFVTDFWGNRATPEEIDSVSKCPVEELVSFTAKVATPFWLALLELVTAIVSRNEYYLFEFEEISFSNSTDKIKLELSNLRKALGAVNRARRRVLWNLEHMRFNLIALGHAPGASEQANSDTTMVDAEAGEFAMILNRLMFEKDRVESLMPVVIGACNILEAQRGALESNRVNALTSLAALFVPISVVASIFSMGNQYLPGQQDFWVFWVAAVPLTAVVMMVAYNLSLFSSVISALGGRILGHRSNPRKSAR